MRKIVLVLVVAFAIAGAAYGDTVPSCATAAGSATNVLTGGFSCSIGGLTFSNFTALNSGNTPNPVVNLFMTAITGADGTVNLFFNPNLVAAAGSTADILFYFTVTGGITRVDLSVGGSGATINEIACSSAFAVGSTSCTGTLLADIHAGSQQSAVSDLFSLTSPVYIAKDINLNNIDGTTSVVFSEFSQSFTPPVPEPASMVLLGSGLLGLAGVIRKRIHR